ncbi:hypothetical protein D3C72_2056030 [compost metagenome]
MRPAGQHGERREVIGLDQSLRLGDLPCQLPLALEGDESQRRERHFLAGGFEPLDYFVQEGADEVFALRAHHFAQRHGIDDRRIGDAEIEVPPLGALPEIGDRTHGYAQGLPVHRHFFS